MKELAPKNGQWVWINVGDKSNVGILTYDYRIQCSSCGAIPSSMFDITNCSAEKMKYCPWCGAKMDVVSE